MADSDEIIATNIKSYSRIASLYAGDEPGEEDPVLRKACRDLFSKALPGKKIVEIGCGPGMDSFYFADAGLDVTATDYCQEFLDITNARFPHITTHKMDMTEPNLQQQSYDGIYAFASFLHIPRSKALGALIGLRNLLKPNGVMFLDLIQSNKMDEYTIENWGGRADNPVLFTCYKETEITQILNSAGFNRIEIHHIRSEFYEKIPRLVEREVSQYQVLAIN